MLLLPCLPSAAWMRNVAVAAGGKQSSGTICPETLQAMVGIQAKASKHATSVSYLGNLLDLSAANRKESDSSVGT